jgi:diadenosine tetraphosphate (Ap4A) HIT family hydrolase
MMKALETTCSCEFCEEFLNLPSTPNRTLFSNSELVVLPSIGSFVPGYLLIMPIQHHRSFADLDVGDIRYAGVFTETVRQLVTDHFGSAIVAEHGPGAPGLKSSACCDHAHFHVIPSDPYKVIQAYVDAGGIPHTLKDIGALGKWSQQPYLFLSPLPYVYLAWSFSEGFSSQFVRRVCTQILGYPEFFDWAVFPYTENMLLTRNVLESKLNGILSSKFADRDKNGNM